MARCRVRGAARSVSGFALAAGGDAAYAHGLARMGSAGAFRMWLRVTYGLRKKEGRWQLTHMHASVPFNMDQTFKAAVDLQP